MKGYLKSFKFYIGGVIFGFSGFRVGELGFVCYIYFGYFFRFYFYGRRGEGSIVI